MTSSLENYSDLVLLKDNLLHILKIVYDTNKNCKIFTHIIVNETRIQYNNLM